VLVTAEELALLFDDDELLLVLLFDDVELLRFVDE
jgi:hypothetical protein